MVRNHSVARAGLVALRAASACTRAEDDDDGGRFSIADFQALSWLEGTWRGTEQGRNPFYEGYRRLNDTTIRILYFSELPRWVAQRRTDGDVTRRLCGRRA